MEVIYANRHQEEMLVLKRYASIFVYIRPNSFPFLKPYAIIFLSLCNNFKLFSGGGIDFIRSTPSQILTCKVDPSSEKSQIFIMAVDP